MSEILTYPGRVIIGNSIDVLKEAGLMQAVDYLFLDPPYEDLRLAWQALCYSGLRFPGAMTCFMYPKDIGGELENSESI